MPRCRSAIWACVKARAKVREAAAGVVVLLGQAQGGLALAGHAGREGQPHEAAGGQADALPQADDGIEDGARGPRQRPAVEGHGVVRLPAPAQEARAVRLPLHGALQAALHAQRVDRDSGFSSARARTPPAEQGRALGQVLGAR